MAGLSKADMDALHDIMNASIQQKLDTAFDKREYREHRHHSKRYRYDDWGRDDRLPREDLHLSSTPHDKEKDRNLSYHDYFSSQSGSSNSESYSDDYSSGSELEYETRYVTPPPNLSQLTRQVNLLQILNRLNLLMLCLPSMLLLLHNKIQIQLAQVLWKNFYHN